MRLGEMRFDLTEEHLKLLKNVNIIWDDCEFGAPTIDSKRPYGNSSVLSDMRKILGMKEKTCPHCGEAIESDGKNDYLIELHKELVMALEIILQTQQFQTGTYELDANFKWWYVNK